MATKKTRVRLLSDDWNPFDESRNDPPVPEPEYGEEPPTTPVFMHSRRQQKQQRVAPTTPTPSPMSEASPPLMSKEEREQYRRYIAQLEGVEEGEKEAFARLRQESLAEKRRLEGIPLSQGRREWMERDPILFEELRRHQREDPAIDEAFALRQTFLRNVLNQSVENGVQLAGGHLPTNHYLVVAMHASSVGDPFLKLFWRTGGATIRQEDVAHVSIVDQMGDKHIRTLAFASRVQHKDPFYDEMGVIPYQEQFHIDDMGILFSLQHAESDFDIFWRLEPVSGSRIRKNFPKTLQDQAHVQEIVLVLTQDASSDLGAMPPRQFLTLALSQTK